MVKNKDLSQFKSQFDLLKNLTGIKFVLTINRNFKLVKDEVEVLDKIKEPSKEFEAFRKDAREAYTKHSLKNDDGSAKTKLINGPQGPINRFVPDPAQTKKLEAALKKITEKYKKDIDIHDKKELDFIEALDKESGITLQTIGEDDLPEGITTEQLQLVMSVGIVK